MATEISGEKIGIMGGSYDPIHYGHLNAAREVMEARALDRIIFVPSARPPHKCRPDMLEERHRFILTRMAVCSEPRFQVSDLELRRPGLSFTVDTIAHFTSQYPGAELYFIMGMDALMMIGSWREPERIAAMCRSIIVVSRPGNPVLSSELILPGLSPDFHSRLDYFKITGMDISSTTIRKRVREGLPISYLVPPEVEAYIDRNALYRSKG